MTIFTSKLSDHKDDPGIPAPEVVTEPLVTNWQNEKKEKAMMPPAMSPTLITITARRRRSNFANVCVLLTALLVLAIGVIGGIYLYKHLAHRTFRGWCGVRYYDMQKKYHGEPQYDGHFEEHVELDKENGYYEKVEVPEFDECRKAVIVHDFRTNLTVIADEDRGHCFVKPLNRTNVKPPQDFFDLLIKIKTGYYLPDATVIHQRYSVIQTPVHNLQPFGYYIWQMCKNYDTYWLERMPDHEPYAMVKRSVADMVSYSEGASGVFIVKDHIEFDQS